MSFTVRSLARMAAALCLAGCTNVAAPSPPTASFLLKSIGARPLPTPAVVAPNVNSVTILSEVLFLDGIGIATRSTTVQGATPGSSQRVVARYAYTLVDDVLTLGDPPCGVADICLGHAPERGTIVAGVLTLSSVAGGVSAPAYVYQRIMPD